MEPKMREMLVCPICKGSLLEDRQDLQCVGCHQSYSIINGIPNFLPDNLFKSCNVTTRGQDIQEEKKFYENMYSNLQGIDDGHCVVYGYQDLYDFMDDIPTGALLDVGCGAGHHSKDLAIKGFDVIGVDISLNGLIQAKKVTKTSGQNVGFILGDIENLPFPDSSFDVVFCGLILHHFLNKKRVLKELNRVCKRFFVAFEVNSYDPISFFRFNILNPLVGIPTITKNQRTVSPRKLEHDLRKLGFANFVFQFVDVHHYTGRYPDNVRTRLLKIWSVISKLAPYKWRFNKFIMKCTKDG